jgi:hypothetical protein
LVSHKARVPCMYMAHGLHLLLRASQLSSRPYVPRFDIRAPFGPAICDQARPARPLLKLRKLRFHGELAWGEPIDIWQTCADMRTLHMYYPFERFLCQRIRAGHCQNSRRIGVLKPQIHGFILVVHCICQKSVIIFSLD